MHNVSKFLWGICKQHAWRRPNQWHSLFLSTLWILWIWSERYSSEWALYISWENIPKCKVSLTNKGSNKKQNLNKHAKNTPLPRLSLIHTQTAPQETPTPPLVIPVQTAHEPFFWETWAWLATWGGLANEKSPEVGVASKKIMKDQKFHLKLFALLQHKSPGPEQCLAESATHTKV